MESIIHKNIYRSFSAINQFRIPWDDITQNI
jgi:hypothetical protein